MTKVKEIAIKFIFWKLARPRWLVESNNGKIYICFKRYLCLRIFLSFFPDSNSYCAAMENRVKDLQRQISEMTDEIRKINALLTDFANCKGCIKKLYKATLERDSGVFTVSSVQAAKEERRGTPPHSIITNISTFHEPAVQASTPKPASQTSSTDVTDQVQSKSMLIGSPSRGVYVQKSKMDLIKTNHPRLFALKLFELVFRREEAKEGSVEGKGGKLSQLDPNRIAAIKDETEKRFPEEYVWPEIKKALDEKCRMVRNNRCFVWAGQSNVIN